MTCGEVESKLNSVMNRQQNMRTDEKYEKMFWKNATEREGTEATTHRNSIQAENWPHSIILSAVKVNLMHEMFYAPIQTLLLGIMHVKVRAWHRLMDNIVNFPHWSWSNSSWSLHNCMLSVDTAHARAREKWHSEWNTQSRHIRSRSTHARLYDYKLAHSNCKSKSSPFDVWLSTSASIN